MTIEMHFLKKGVSKRSVLELFFCFPGKVVPGHKPKLVGLDVFQCGGGLPCERVGAKTFGISFETQETKVLSGISRDIPPKSARNFGKIQKGSAGRGRAQKRHDNLRQFTTFY